MKGLKCIGRGSFSKVYKKDANTVLIVSNDYMKECLSMEWFNGGRLFPKVKIVGDNLYEMKYYEKVSSLKDTLEPKEYEFYKVLRNLFSDLQYPIRSHDNYNVLYKEFSNIPNKFKHKRSLLLDALDTMVNYGQDICFEISPRNVAVDKGKLILLDCFFIKSQLLKSRP